MFNFQTGNAAGMDTTAGVEIGRSLRVQAGTVGVTGNKVQLIFYRKGRQPLLRMVFPGIVLSRTGRV